MTAVPPSPQTTLVILLGASKWPFSPEFQASKAFLNSAMELRAYFLDPSQFGLPQENLLNLFNSNQSADDIDGEIGLFLEKRVAEMKQAGETARDLVVYFVGHGGFVGDDSDFYLAIRRTRTDNPGASGIQMESLAYTLKEKARYLRRIVILDCCFAGAAFSAFQAAGPAQVAIVKTVDAFGMQGKGTGLPERGTSLLCSSRHTAPSLISQDGTHTLFSQALCRALSTGNPQRQDALSLRAIADLTEDVLAMMPEKSVPRPEVHSPDQVDGDVADVPIFPNPAVRAARASADVETAPVVEQPPQPIYGQPSPERPSPPLRQTQQQPYPSNAGPGSAPSSDQLQNVPRLSRGMIIFFIALILLVVAGSVGFFYFTRNNPNNPNNPYPPFGTLALDDPLSDNSHGYNWLEGSSSGGTCTFTGGAYHGSDEQNGGYHFCIATSPNFSNFASQVQMTIVKGGAGGIIFRLDNDGDFYVFDIRQNGQYELSIYKKYWPVRALGSGSSTAINTGLNQSNLVAVVANGSTIDLYVNKQKIGSVSDSSYSQGQIGVFAADVNGPTEVVFSDAKVWKV